MTHTHVRTMVESSLVAAALLLSAGVASAQEVGTVASVEGAAEIGNGGAWTAAATGSPVHRGDQLRTGTPGRMRVVFQDDSVLVVSESSFVTVNEQVFNPSTGKAKSYLELLQGKVSAVVGDYYNRAGNSYEIKTVTAVAGVRGTVLWGDTDLDAICALDGHIEVRAISGNGPASQLAPGECVNQMATGKTAPLKPSAAELAGYLREVTLE